MSRLSVNINNETHAFITKLMEEEGITATEAVRRAFSIYAFVINQQNKGRSFAVMRRSGSIHRHVEFK